MKIKNVNQKLAAQLVIHHAYRAMARMGTARTRSGGAAAPLLFPVRPQAGMTK